MRGRLICGSAPNFGSASVGTSMKIMQVSLIGRCAASPESTATKTCEDA
jgi:hypothetical protein